MLQQTINKLKNTFFGPQQAVETYTPTTYPNFSDFPPEFEDWQRRIFRNIMDQEITMVVPSVLINTIQSATYVVTQNIAGDFVECGVWKGGNSLAARMVFDHLGSDKHVWLFDTFTGMTEPNETEKNVIYGELAIKAYTDRVKDGEPGWLEVDLDAIKANFARSARDEKQVHFIEGDVRKTLADENNLPKQISLLRLDTDFHDSTKMELETLYPRLSRRGILIVDDYGYWSGSRTATDEFFADGRFEAPLLQVIYAESCRCGIKTD